MPDRVRLDFRQAKKGLDNKALRPASCMNVEAGRSVQVVGPSDTNPLSRIVRRRSLLFRSRHSCDTTLHLFGRNVFFVG